MRFLIFTLGLIITSGLYAQECQKGDCVNGEGTYVYSDGSKYIGEFKDSKCNGFGIIFYASGDKFVGEFRDHAVSGHGAWYYKGGEAQPGYYDDRNNFVLYNSLQTGCLQGNCDTGSGSYLWTGGVYYIGQFSNSEPNGYGICYFSDGGKYEGQWKDKKFHGEGTYYNAEGTIQRGMWMDHKYVGATSSTGTVSSTGCISGNCENGFGIYRYDDGGVYTGEFKNGFREGTGTYYWATRGKYVGAWVQGNMNGQGTYTDENGKIQAGIFKDGQLATSSDVSALLAEIHWEDPVTATSKVPYATVNIKACIKSETDVISVRGILNGKVAFTETSFKDEALSGCKVVLSKAINLSPGSNSLKITAENKAGVATSSDRTIELMGQTKQKRLALVIGNSNYKTANVLKNPLNDARSMSHMLESQGFTVILKEDVSTRDLKMAIDQFGRRLKEESFNVGLFYYAGHGIQVKGSNYLVPVDADIQDEAQVEYDCVQADRVLSYMEIAGTEVNVIILDACRNNPFKRSWSRSTDSGGLAFMNAPSGTLIAYATAPGHTAADGTGQNGLYTEALLEEMQNPDLSILQVFQRVRAKVSEKSSKGQIPWESTSLTGDFYVAKHQ